MATITLLETVKLPLFHVRLLLMTHSQVILIARFATIQEAVEIRDWLEGFAAYDHHVIGISAF